MKIRSLYIFLTFLTIAFLLGGISFIYFDGQKEIKMVKEVSQEDIEKSLLVMSFFSKFKSFIQITETNQSALEEELKELKTLQREIEQRIRESEKIDLSPTASLYRDYFNGMKRRLFLKQKIVKLEKKGNNQWKKIESFVSDEVVKQLKSGQEFLPDFKDTLSRWGESIPLLEKLKNSIDVSYVNQDKFSELKELMSFSNWLLRWKIDINDKQTNSTESFKRINDKLRVSKISSDFKTEFLFRVDEYLKNLKKLNQLDSQYLKNRRTLDKTSSKANMLLTQSLIPNWQGNLNQNLEKSILNKNKRHQFIVQVATIMGVFIVLVMSFLFLNIFPFLNTLEQKAKLVGKGDFLVKIDKKIPNNEIGQVMIAFNEMTTELSNYLEKIKFHEQEKTQLTNSIQKMRRVNELGEFSAKMAHELKNPLSILNFCLNDALEASTNGDSDKCINELKKSLHALERLKVISGRLGAKSSFTESESINVSLMIKELVGMYDSIVSKEKISINIHSEDDDALINGPKLELMGAISNLIDNAIEYFKSRKTLESNIEVIIRKDIENVFIEVASNGKHIEDPDKLFNSFYSDKNNITRGMGLVIVKDIVESIEGSIDYCNERGMNRFIIKLPASQDSGFLSS